MNKLDFVQVPMSALIELEDTNLKVYAIIYTSCKLNDNKFYHSYQQFADDLCVSVRNIKYSIKYLVDNGYIEVESGRGAKKPNVYHILNSATDCTINNNGAIDFPINGATGCTNNGAMYCTQKEYINKKENNKEKKVKRKEMNTGKQTTKCESNKPSVIFKDLDLKLNSHSTERCDSSNVPTVNEAVANNEQCSMDCGYIPIDELEDIHNGGQTIPTKPSTQALATKYTPRDDWNKAMANIKSKVETDTKLNQTDLQMLLEGANDAYRVIDTLKTLKMLMRNYVRLACYNIFLDDCDATITTIQSEKQRKYADEILKECDKYYEHYRKTVKKAV